jgi:hypothetical protein
MEALFLVLLVFGSPYLADAKKTKGWKRKLKLGNKLVAHLGACKYRNNTDQRLGLIPKQAGWQERALELIL